MVGKSLRQRLVFGAISNWLAFAATLLVGFFLMPYLVRKLGHGPYGVWAFVESILAYFTLFDLGLAACVVRFVARYHATRNHDDLNRLIATCLALFLGLGVFVALCGGALLPFILGSIRAVGIGQREVVLFALLMLGNLALTLPLSVFPSILDGLERFGSKSAVRVVVLVIRTAATVLVMEHRPSLLNLGLVLTVCNLLEHAALAWLSFRCLPVLRLRWRSIDRATLRRVKGYSLNAFLAMVAGRMTVQSGPIIVGMLFGASPVTFFTIAARLVDFAKALLRTATNTLTPAVSSLEAEGDIDAIRRMLLGATRWVLYLILPVQLGLIVFGSSFLDIWMRSWEYADRCYPVLVVLSSTLALVVAQSVAARILYGVGKLHWFARMALLEAVANVLLSVLLSYRYGLIGIAYGVMVPNIMMNVWVIAYTLHYLELSWGEYLRASWFKPSVAMIALPIMWLLPSWPVKSWLMLGAAIGCGLLPYACIVLILEDRLPRWLWHTNAFQPTSQSPQPAVSSSSELASCLRGSP